MPYRVFFFRGLAIGSAVLLFSNLEPQIYSADGKRF
jgi:hypothetical protein